MLAAACIIDRSAGKTDVGVPLIALAEYEVPAYPADDLPPELASHPAGQARQPQHLRLSRARCGGKVELMLFSDERVKVCCSGFASSVAATVVRAARRNISASAILRLRASPHAIAAGVAAGVFASFIPFLGLHIIIAAVVCLADRAATWLQQRSAPRPSAIR